MWRLVPALVPQMGAAYPELVRAQALITETLKLEETNFKQTLERGLKLLDEETASCGRGAGLPRRRRLQALRHVRLSARSDAGRVARARPPGRDRRLRRGDGAAARRGAQELGRLGRGGDRGDLVRPAREARRHRIPRLRHRVAEGRSCASSSTARRSSEAEAGDEAAIIVNQTPFYGESGGQHGRHRPMFTAAGGEFAVRDTQKQAGDLFVHLGTVDARRAQGRRRRRAARRRRRAARSCAPIIR